jgi:ketosteroid isomerase-like protein
MRARDTPEPPTDPGTGHSGSGQEDDANRRAAAQHTVAEHLRLTAAGRTDEWVTLFAPDAVLEFPFAPVGVPRRVTGRDALFAHMSSFPETFDIEFVDLVFHETVDPSLVIAEFRLVLSVGCDRVSLREPTAPRSARRLVFASSDRTRTMGRSRASLDPGSIRPTRGALLVVSERCPSVIDSLL